MPCISILDADHRINDFGAICRGLTAVNWDGLVGMWIVRNRKQIEERIRFLDEELKAERNAMLKLGTWGNFNESALEIKRLTAAVKKAVELRATLIKELERL